MPVREDESPVELDVTFEDLTIKTLPNYRIAVCSNGFISFGIPNDSTYKSLTQNIIERRYTQEEQTNIITRKDLSNDTKADFEHMQGWVNYAKTAAKHIMGALGEPVEDTLEDAKIEKIIEINAYDNSSVINSFKYGDYDLWFDKQTRVGLMNSTAILQNAGEENTTLWYGDICVTLPCKTVILILSQIEMYALECYNVTAQHKANVNALATIDEVKAYDYTTGYPEKLIYKAQENKL